MSPAPDPDAVRIGTAEREEATRVLGVHFAEGRMTTEEYETRVSAVFTVETRAGLRPLFADLPAPQPVFLLPPVPYPPSYPQPRYPPAGGYYGPARPVTMSDKSKVIAGILQIVFPFGVGRFYTGHVGMGIAQLLVTVVTFGLGAIWPVVDGIILLSSGGTDSYGRRLLG